MTEPSTSNSPVGFDRPILHTGNLTAAGLSIVAVTYGLARYCFGLFLPDIQRDFALSPEVVGLIAGSSYIGYLLATSLGSWLSTTIGPRLPILLGGLAASTGMMIIAVAPSPLLLALGVFIAGTSPGLSYPPFSDVIVHHLEPSRQNTVYAWINSGTGFGVAFAGPMALFATEDWRLAWMIFAAVALLVTFWNMASLPVPQGERRKPHESVSFRFFLRPQTRQLFAAASLFGIVSAVYWTYSVDLLRRLSDDPRSALVFWLVLGVAGVCGCFAGGLVNRWGLHRAYRALVFLVGSAIASLPLLSQLPFGIFSSAAIFGIGFIVMTALLGIWSMQTCRDMPSMGFGMTFFLLSLGQGLGPVVSGFLIPVLGLPTLFVVAGLLCFTMLFQAPERQNSNLATA